MKVRYLVEKPGATGPSWHWQPSTLMRARGIRPQKLNARTREEAEALAEAIKAEVDGQRLRAQEAGQDAATSAGQRPAQRRGDGQVGGRPYLYVIGSQKGPQKIGISVAPEQRRRALETAGGRQLEIWLLVGGRATHARQLERLAHLHLAAHRREGEWFAVMPHKAIAAVVHAMALVGAEAHNVSES